MKGHCLELFIKIICPGTGNIGTNFMAGYLFDISLDKQMHGEGKDVLSQNRIFVKIKVVVLSDFSSFTR